MQPEIASWIVEGLAFVEGRIAGLDKKSINKARELWSE